MALGDHALKDVAPEKQRAWKALSGCAQSGRSTAFAVRLPRRSRRGMRTAGDCTIGLSKSISPRRDGLVFMSRTPGPSAGWMLAMRELRRCKPPVFPAIGDRGAFRYAAEARYRQCRRGSLYHALRLTLLSRGCLSDDDRTVRACPYPHYEDGFTEQLAWTDSLRACTDSRPWHPGR